MESDGLGLCFGGLCCVHDEFNGLNGTCIMESIMLRFGGPLQHEEKF